MGIIKSIKKMKAEMTGWRRHLHENPEVSGTEKNTAAFLEEKLQSFGLQTERLGSYGVVATLSGRTNNSGKTIMLRADTDALPITEATGLDYASKNKGVMHACGHDGHMAMLLGAAKHLTENPDFDGTVHFLFQPAEETGTGAAEMIRAGLFDKFPAEAVYGLHNSPIFPLGLLGTRAGEMLSAENSFILTFSGKGGHASDPDKTTDVLAAAARAVLLLKQDYKSHIIKGDTAVLSATAFHTSSNASNVLSDSVVVKGTIRSFDGRSQKELLRFLEKTAKAAAASEGAQLDIRLGSSFPILKNTADETKTAVKAARKVFGRLRVIEKAPLTLGTEDFAYLLQQKPGNYMAMGTGSVWTAVSKKKVEGLHSPKYDFNDKALPVGASYWVNLVKQALPPASNPPPRACAPAP